jgi:hypothetical protein
LAPIALCSIDLALAYAKQGKAARRFPALLEDLAEHRDAQPWALGALTWFRDALDQGEDPATAAWRAAELVHRRETPGGGRLLLPVLPGHRLTLRGPPDTICGNQA